MKFCEMAYSRPNIDELVARANALKEKIEKAERAEEIISAYDELCILSEEYSTMGSLAYVRHTIDTNDEFYDKENDFFDEVGPRVTDAFQGVTRVMATSPKRAELEAHYGELLFKNIDISLRCEDLFLIYISISFSIHLDAYVASLIFLSMLNVDTAFISPTVPIDISSSIFAPVFSNFFAMYTTRRRLCSIRASLEA